MLLPLLLSLTAAAEVHGGIPIEAVDEALEPARFQSARLGYTRDFPKGLLRVYVGPTELAAMEWFSDMEALMGRHKPEPLSDLGDTAVAAGDGMILAREGNIGVLVECASGARSWADKALAAIVHEAPAPRYSATLVGAAGAWQLDGGDAAHVSWVGGTLDLAAARAEGPIPFQAPPRRVVTWDHLGRATVQDYDASGRPTETPAPRPSPDFDPEERSAPAGGPGDRAP